MLDRPVTKALCVVLVALGVALAPTAVHAGGGPESAVLVVDPDVPDSLYVANHYITARDVPASNVLYMSPTAGSYEEGRHFTSRGNTARGRGSAPKSDSFSSTCFSW